MNAEKKLNIGVSYFDLQNLVEPIFSHYYQQWLCSIVSYFHHG